MLSGDVYEAKPHEYLSSSSTYLFLSLEVLQLCFISPGNSREDGVGSYSTSHAVGLLGFFVLFFFHLLFLVLI